tara:strand:- start:160 stop:489 length:330 start_codon:yes stop_codon:yes gene_type:complete
MIDTIKSRKDFLSVQNNGNKVVTVGFILQSAINTNCEKATRFGFTASRKIGSAVIRNKAKRRLRALVQEILIEKCKPGIDYVLVARKTTPTRKFEKLRKDLFWAINNLG